MSKHSNRHAKAKMIRAAEKSERILFDICNVEWIQAADGGGENQPKRFSMTAYTGGPMQVGFGYPVVVNLEGLNAAAPVPILLNHDIDKIVGHADEVEKTSAILKLSGLISGSSKESEQVKASAAQGFPWKASIGARPDKLDFFGENAVAKVNGKTFKGPLYVASKATLGEVSFVPMAADSKTSTKIAASAAHSEKENDMEFKEWLKALFGGEAPDLRDDQMAALKARFDAEAKKAEPPKPGETKPIQATAPAPAFDLSAVNLTYEKHVSTVEAKAATYNGKIESAKLAEIRANANGKAAELKLQALNEQWPAARLEVALVKAQADAEVSMIRAERPTAPAIHGSTRDLGMEVIQAAFCRSVGIKNLDKQFKPEVLEAADKLPGFGIQELLLRAAGENGYSGRMKITDGNLREVLKAAFSTHTITTLLTTTGNKILLDGFMAIPQTWRELAQVRSVSDFKQVTAYRLTADLEYEKVGPAGEIKHGTLSQESYTIQVDTYAKMLALTRQDIINDDLGAFNDLRNRFGIGAALAMNKRFWTVFLTASNGGAFWTAARGNLVTGSALAETGLNTAVAAFRNLKGPDGNHLGLEPDRILVPPALEATARKLYVSQEQRDTTASTKFPTANIYYNRFRPVVIPQLGDSTYTGYSATTWYLLAPPAVLACAIMSFLNGVENPVIESTDADFNTLGIQFRGYTDFGADMSEYRSSVEAQA